MYLRVRDWFAVQPDLTLAAAQERLKDEAGIGVAPAVQAEANV